MDSPDPATAPGASRAASTAEEGLAFYPLASPLRLLDTRPGRSGVYAPAAPLRSEVLYRYTAPSKRIPDTARALVVSVSLDNYVPTWTEYDPVWRDTWSWTAADTDYRLYPRVELFASDTWQPATQELIRVGSGPLRATAQVVTVPLDATGTFSLRPARNPLRIPGNPDERTGDQWVASYSFDAVIDVIGYYAPVGSPGALYLHLLDKRQDLVDWCNGYCWPKAPISLAPYLQGGSVVSVTATGNFIDGERSGTFGLPPNARYLVGSLSATSTASHPGQSSLVNIYPAGAARPETGLVIQDGGGESAQFLVSLSSAGAFSLTADRGAFVAVDVAGYFSDQPADDGNGVGLVYTPRPRAMQGDWPLLGETEFAEFQVLGPDAPANTRAVSGRIEYSVGGEPGSSLSIHAGGRYLASFGSDLRAPLADEAVDEATFVRRFDPAAHTVIVGPGAPDLWYAQVTLDLAGYFSEVPGPDAANSCEGSASFGPPPYQLPARLQGCAGCLNQACTAQLSACAADAHCNTCLLSTLNVGNLSSCLPDALLQAVAQCSVSSCSSTCDLNANVVTPPPPAPTCDMPPPVERIPGAPGLTWPATPVHPDTGRTCAQCLGALCGDSFTGGTTDFGLGAWDQVDSGKLAVCLSSRCALECAGGDPDLSAITKVASTVLPSAPQLASACGEPWDNGCHSDGCSVACPTSCRFNVYTMGNADPPIKPDDPCSDDGNPYDLNGNLNPDFIKPACTTQGVINKVRNDNAWQGGPNFEDRAGRRFAKLHGSTSWYYAKNECKWFLKTGYYLVEVVANYMDLPQYGLAGGPFVTDEGGHVKNWPEIGRVIGRLEPGCNAFDNSCPRTRTPNFEGKDKVWANDVWRFKPNTRSNDLVVFPAGVGLDGLPYGVELGSLVMGVRQSYAGGISVLDLAVDYRADAQRLWNLYQLVNCGQPLGRVVSESGGSAAAEMLVREHGGTAYLYGTPLHGEDDLSLGGTAPNGLPWSITIINNSHLDCDPDVSSARNRDVVAGSAACSFAVNGLRLVLLKDSNLHKDLYCKKDNVGTASSFLTLPFTALTLPFGQRTNGKSTCLDTMVQKNNNHVYLNYTVGKGRQEAHTPTTIGCFYEEFLSQPFTNPRTESPPAPPATSMFPRSAPQGTNICANWAINNWRWLGSLAWITASTGGDARVEWLDGRNYITCPDNRGWIRPDVNAVLLEYTSPVAGAVYEAMQFPQDNLWWGNNQPFCYNATWYWGGPNTGGCDTNKPPAQAWDAVNGGHLLIPSAGRRAQRKWVIVPDSYRDGFPTLQKLPASTYYAPPGVNPDDWFQYGAYDSLSAAWNGYKPAFTHPADISSGPFEFNRPELAGKHISLVGVQFKNGVVRVADWTTHSHPFGAYKGTAQWPVDPRCQTGEAETPDPPELPPGSENTPWACGVPGY